MNRTDCEQVGKVFVAVAGDLRLCLVCEGVFSRKEAAEHATTVCHVSAANAHIILDPRPHVTLVMSHRAKS